MKYWAVIYNDVLYVILMDSVAFNLFGFTLIMFMEIVQNSIWIKQDEDMVWG